MTIVKPPEKAFSAPKAPLAMYWNTWTGVDPETTIAAIASNVPAIKPVKTIVLGAPS